MSGYKDDGDPDWLGPDEFDMFPGDPNYVSPFKDDPVHLLDPTVNPFELLMKKLTEE